jgi:hypothetical protein
VHALLRQGDEFRDYFEREHRMRCVEESRVDTNGASLGWCYFCRSGVQEVFDYWQARRTP